MSRRLSTGPSRPFAADTMVEAGAMTAPPDTAGAGSAPAADLVRALERIPARSAQAIRLRLVERGSPGACAAFYGIRTEAFDVLLLRAVRELSAELAADQLPARPLGDDEESIASADLARALDGTSPPRGRDAALAVAIAQRAGELDRLLRARDAALAAGEPLWMRALRLAVIAALIAAALLLSR